MSGKDDFMAHEAYRDEVAAYALGALESSERFEVERHLDGCKKCREYLLWLDPALGLLPMSVDQLRPPRQLKRSVMGEVHAELKATRKTERERKRASRGLWGSIWRPVTAAAVSLVLIAGVVGGYALRGDDEPPVVATKAFIEANSTEPGVGPALAATLEHDGAEGTLHVEKMPALAKDKVYQAWIQRDGRMEPSTVFVVNSDGRNEVPIEGSLEGATGVYITREPEPGSKHPTFPVIMRAPLN